MAWEEPRKTGMVYRRLGNSGLHVSAIGLGGWLTYGGHVGDGELTALQVTSHACCWAHVVRLSNWVITEKTFECMKQAYDLGVNFFDTAEK